MHACQASPTASFPRRHPIGAALLFALILAFTVLTRLPHLGDRVLNHDESLFAYYGWYLANGGAYDHNPLLHGPLQIEIIAAVLHARDALKPPCAAETAARLPAAMAGILVVALAWAFRRWLGWGGAALGALFLAVSPGLWYYSRFCRNEALFVAASLAAVAVASRTWSARRPAGGIVLSMALVAILVSLKENSLFLLFDGATFLALATAAKGGSIPRLVGRSLRRDRYAWLAGLALAFLIVEAVYTQGFRWPRDFLETYRGILTYWAGQHREHRLYGEFHYHLRLLALYEPLLVLVGIAAAGRAILRRGAWVGRWGAAVWAFGGWGAATLGQHWWARTHESVWPVLRAMHMTHPWHLGFALLAGWLTLCGAWRCLRGHRPMRAWLVWWTGLGLLQYSYAGEKVPWLVVHIAAPAALLAGDVVAGWLARLREAPVRRGLLTALVVVLAGWNALQGARLCFVNATNPAEWMVYNHTRPEIADTAASLTDAARAGEGVMVQGEAGWPLAWYLRDVRFTNVEGDSEADLEGIDWVVCDPSYARRSKALRDTFGFDRVELRRAWVAPPLRLWPFEPTGGARGWRRLGHYVLWRDPWGADSASEYCLTGRRLPGR